MSIASPDTFLEFDYLPKDGKKSVLYEHGGFRISPVSARRIEVLSCFFVLPDHDPSLRRTVWPESFRRWIPITDLRFFGVGTQFLNGQQISKKHFCNVMKVPDVKTSSIHSLIVDGPDLRILSTDTLEKKGLLRDDGGVPFLRAYSNKRELFISPIECVRFFFTSFSRLAIHMLSTWDVDAAKNTLLDPVMTGYIDEDTYQIAPNPAIADAATSLQLALVITSPDLMEVWESFIHILNSMRIHKKEMSPEFPFPINSKFLDFSYIPSRCHMGDDGPRRVYRVRQIFNDRRDIPFKNLVVVNPGFDFDPLLQEQDNRKTREFDIKRLIKANIRNSGSNSTKTSVIFSGMPGLVDAFPKLSDVKVRVRRKKKFYTSKYKLIPSGKVIDLKDVSSADPDATNIVQNIIFRPHKDTTQRFGGMTFEPGQGRELFSQVIEGTPELLPNLPSKSGRYIRLLVSAATELETLIAGEGRKMGASAISNIKLTIYGLPKSWGQWARDPRDKSQRIIGVITLEYAGVFVYFIEIDRQSKHEFFAMGVLTHVTGRELSDCDLACVMLHCDYRIKLRGRERVSSEAYSGIWPTRLDYIDVNGTKIVHRDKRMHPHFLAKDMLSFAEKLKTKIIKTE